MAECLLNSYTYSVTVPDDLNSPPEIFYKVSFFCNGTYYLSPAFDTAESALAYANDEWGAFGVWTLSGDILTLTESECANGNLSYQIVNAVDVYGCTTFGSSNYDPLATIDDGSCIPPVAVVEGCMNDASPDYNPLATVDDGSCTFPDGNVTFNIAAAKTIETRIGANLFESDANDLATWQADAITLALQTYYWTPSGTMSNSNATKLNNFLTAVGADMGTYYSIQSNTVAAAFPTLLDWLVTKFNPSFIQLDQESQAGAGITNATYVARSQQVIAHVPSIQTSFDTAPIWKISGTSVDRNLALAPLTDTDWGRQYAALHESITFSATDQAQNLLLIDNYYDTLYPQWTTDFFALLTHLTKIPILQFKNTRYTPIPQSLENYSIIRMGIFLMQHTEFYSHLFWMTGSNIFNHTWLFNAMKRLSLAFRYTHSIPITLPYDRVKGVGLWNGSSGYAILLVNSGTTEYTINASDIQISGKTVSGNFTVNAGYADDFSQSQTDATTVAATATIKKCSGSLITFNVV